MNGGKLLGKMGTIRVEATGYLFLQKELKLAEHHLVNIMIKYPSIMYLRVESNLRPTVEVYKSFGFREKDIRRMVETCPYILAINHEWTLPEKLISIQKMFNLPKTGLIKIVVERPYLLTSSIERNIEVSNYLTEEIGLSPEHIRRCMLGCPGLSMTSVTVIAACWSVLTNVYALSSNDARHMCLRQPKVLTKITLKNSSDRITFFSEELDMVPPFADVQKVVLRCPQVLWLDVEVFMRPNCRILREQLGLDREGVKKLLSFFPAVLCYNPATLTRACRRALAMLTGLEEYRRGGSSKQSELDEYEEEEQKEAEAEAEAEEGAALDEADFVNEQDSATVHARAAASAAVVGAEASGVSLDVPLLLDDGDDDGFADPFHAAEGDESDFFVAEMGLGAASAASSVSGSRKGRTGGAAEYGYEEVEEAPVVVATETVTLGSLDIISSIVANAARKNSHANVNGTADARLAAHASAVLGTPAALSALSSLELMRLLMQMYSSLTLSKEQALSVLRCAPWVLSYRPERSLRVLSTLGVSLGLTRSELSSCVARYPRLLCLSADGKISELFGALAETAAACLEMQQQDALDRPEGGGAGAETSSVKKKRKPRKSAAVAIVDADGELDVAAEDGDDSDVVVDGDVDLERDLFAVLSAERSSSTPTTGTNTNTNTIDTDTEKVTDTDTSNHTSSSTSVADSVLSDVLLVRQALARRRDPVRTLLRRAVLQWPHILGTSMENKIAPVLRDIATHRLSFEELVPMLRRSPAQQRKRIDHVLDERQKRAEAIAAAAAAAAAVAAHEEEEAAMIALQHTHTGTHIHTPTETEIEATVVSDILGIPHAAAHPESPAENMNAKRKLLLYQLLQSRKPHHRTHEKLDHSESERESEVESEGESKNHSHRNSLSSNPSDVNSNSHSKRNSQLRVFLDHQSI